MVLRVGSTGELVKILQTKLNMRAQQVDGIFGNETRNMVIFFQKRNKLHPDGIVGPLTWKKIGYDPFEDNLDTDREVYENWIETYHLPPGQYVNIETPKKYIVGHHTAGRCNPYKTIDHWAKDNRGRVGTNYVIGGISADGKNTEYDGKILRAINDEYYGWHIGAGGSFYMKEHSLSIELCSAGYLTEKNGKWYTWFGENVTEDQICFLDQPFKGKTAFHKYSDEQIKSFGALCKYLSKKHGISLKIGMQQLINDNVNAFGWDKEIYDGKLQGLVSHGNIRKDKTDLFPQPELIDLIKSF